MIVMVSGSRTLNDPKHYKWVRGTLDGIHDQFPIELLLHGNAAGPDRFAGAWAITRQVPVEVHQPLWRIGRVYNPRAGFDRNDLMIEKLRNFIANGHRAKLIAFWDSDSHGTREAIDYALRIKVPTEVYG